MAKASRREVLSYSRVEALLSATHRAVPPSQHSSIAFTTPHSGIPLVVIGAFDQTTCASEAGRLFVKTAVRPVCSIRAPKDLPDKLCIPRSGTANNLPRIGGG